MKKKPSLKKLKIEADKLFQSYGLKGKPICFSCRKKRAEVIHHFYPVSIANCLRYSVLNGIPICQDCHFEHHIKNNPEIQANIIDYCGMEWLAYLRDLRKKLKKNFQANREFYEKAIKFLSS